MNFKERRTLKMNKKYEYHVYRISVTFQGKEAVEKGIGIAEKLRKAYGNSSRGAKRVLELWAEREVRGE